MPDLVLSIWRLNSKCYIVLSDVIIFAVTFLFVGIILVSIYRHLLSPRLFLKFLISSCIFPSGWLSKISILACMAKIHLFYSPQPVSDFLIFANFRVTQPLSQDGRFRCLWQIKETSEVDRV